MPTSSQSQILSVVDYQILNQQQTNVQDGTIRPSTRLFTNQASAIEAKRRHSKDYRRPSTGRKDDGDDDNQSPPPPHTTARRRSSGKISDGIPTPRLSQRGDILHMPKVNLNTTGQRESRTSMNSAPYHRSSLNNDNDVEIEYKLQQLKHSTSINAHDNSSLSDLENINDDEDNPNRERRSSLLDENSRRLLILGTIRPSKTFYKNLPDDDVEHLMEYFRRMRNANRRMSSDEINQELKAELIEYKPKIFFDSACVTKNQVMNVEKIIEQYADQIRAQEADIVKLDHPFRFVIKKTNNDTLLTTLPREYNDCFLTLVTRADPLRKSDLITELIQKQFLEEVKANSLDISYFPGGINYEVPREEVNESGQMNLDTYQKLKKRLSNRKIWYFSGPPEKKPNALLAIIPTDSSINIDHQQLLECLYERLKTFSTNQNIDIRERILSIEFIPLSCILNSYDIANQFVIDCDTIETKQQLMEKPLKYNLNKNSMTIELQSYDENMRREYEKSVKAEKYRELIKNHEQAVKRKSSTT